MDVLSGPMIPLALGIDPIASEGGHFFDDGAGYVGQLFG